jgi:hypothetical protein
MFGSGRAPRFIVAAAMGLIAVTGCSPSPGVSGAPPPAAGPGTISGRVTYADGRPLAGAHILVNAREYDSQTERKSAADGTYSIKLAVPDATYDMYAWVGPIDFNGHQYELPLRFTGGNPGAIAYPEDGLVQDLTWETTGEGSWAPLPGEPQSNNGGWLGVNVYDPSTDPGGDQALTAPAGTKIELSLNPVTPLIDGSAGVPLTATVTFADDTGPSWISNVGTVVDIPVAMYDVSATLVALDGTRTPLLTAWRCTQNLGGVFDCPFIEPSAFGPTARIDFGPADPDAHVAPYDSYPTQKLELYVKEP